MFFPFHDLQLYLSLDQGYDRKTGSGNTDPYTKASHSGTLQAGSFCNTAHRPFEALQNKCVTIMSFLLQKCDTCTSFRQTYVSIIFLKSKTPTISLAANLQRRYNCITTNHMLFSCLFCINVHKLLCTYGVTDDIQLIYQ